MFYASMLDLSALYPNHDFQKNMEPCPVLNDERPVPQENTDLATLTCLTLFPFASVLLGICLLSLI